MTTIVYYLNNLTSEQDGSKKLGTVDSICNLNDSINSKRDWYLIINNNQNCTWIILWVFRRHNKKYALISSIPSY